MRKGRELWRTFRVNDRIRLVELPPEFRQAGYHVHQDTLGVYRKLIGRRHPLRIREVDAYGVPWVVCRLKRRDGRWEVHSLAVNHGGLVRVRPRCSPSPR